MSLFLLLACSPVPTIVPGDPAEGLESATVSSAACAESYDACLDTELGTGPLGVTGSADSPTLSVDGVEIAVHSPTSAPLAELAGREVTATVRSDWMLPTSLQLADEAGVVFVTETGAGDAFGLFDVRYGATLGETITEDDWVLTFHTAILETDDGPVELTPGDIVGVTVGGVSWRFGLVAAYDVGTLPNGEYADCGGRSPILSYEAMRVESEVAEVRLLRPEGLALAQYSGCGG